MNRLRRHMPEVRAIAARSPLDDRTDADLLDRFARYGEHAAFEVLLRRHAPVVFGVCRRMLSNPADADDAFQATFLVLVRRAGHVRGERLGPWLYGVAVRVAQKARSFASRNAARHTEATDMLPDPSEPRDSADWLPILDAELAAVPAKYREPMVLCELQGMSRAAAAKALGIREGTLSSRLSRGREMLRKRLLRHGTLLPAGGLAALLPAEGRGAASSGLLARTAELGTGAAGAVPAGPARLTDEVVKSMFLTKLKAVGGAALAVGLVAVGLLAASPADPPTTAKQTPPAAAVALADRAADGFREEEPPPKRKSPDDRVTLQGYWETSSTRLTMALAAEPDPILSERNRHRRYYFIDGDVWWMISPQRVVNNSQQPLTKPYIAKLSPDNTPKWLDMTPWSPDDRVGALPRATVRADEHIYTIDWEDRFEVVYSNDLSRPAEFDNGDKESKLYATLHHRLPLPRPSGAAFVGSWAQTLTTFPLPWRIDTSTTSFSARVEVYDSFIFIGNLPIGPSENEWVGGTYRVDAGRNPAGIDIDLFHQLPNGATKLHGSIAMTGERLQFVVGLTGKRAARPMDFAPHKEGMPVDRWYFDMKRAERPRATPK